jgi:hypothetical protein
MLSIVCPMLPSLIDELDSSVVGMVNFNITRMLALLLSLSSTLAGANPFHHAYDATGKDLARPSENAQQAKFAQITFYALG